MADRSWIDSISGLADMSSDDKALLQSRAALIKAQARTVVFEPGMAADRLLLLLKGTVRVQQLAESGREIVLYRVQAGECCVLTTSCLLAAENYTAEGIAETAIEAVTVARADFEQLLAQSELFRKFVFMFWSQRITDLFVMVESLAFERMEVRLARKLLELSNGESRLDATHHELAVELGSAREVMSRQLAKLQRRGWILQKRGVIEITDIDNLQALADG